MKKKKNVRNGEGKEEPPPPPLTICLQVMTPSRFPEGGREETERTEGSVEGGKVPKKGCGRRRGWECERERKKGGGGIGAGEREVSASHRH